MKILLKILFISIYLLADQNIEESLIQEITAKKFYNNPTWMSLNYYIYDRDDNKIKSDIINKSSYFIGNSNNYKEELIATIKHLFTNKITKQERQQRLCKYVDRLEFIKNISSKNKYNFYKCLKFEKYYKKYIKSDFYYGIFDSGKKSSQIYGHSVLILQPESTYKKMNPYRDNHYLIFGVPDKNRNNHPVTDTFKGLFGLYNGVYSVMNNSDMLASYDQRGILKRRLILNIKQKKMLMSLFYLYKYNKRESKMVYMFIDKNCAYRLYNLLQIVYDARIEFINYEHVWFEPIDIWESKRIILDKISIREVYQ